MPESPLFTVSPADVVAFWRDAGPTRWFRKDSTFDDECRARFAVAHDAAMRGEFDHWASDATSTLALLILLDQIPRNVFRGTARMFESDAQARAFARHAVAHAFDAQVDADLRNFLYLPFMHSEDLSDQDFAVSLTRKLGDEPLRYAVLHRDIIERFGRFPHRNAVLGRETTPEEQRFLDDGGFAG
ncbi:MAG: DUF924 family protein [Ramlibacter sp.]